MKALTFRGIGTILLRVIGPNLSVGGPNRGERTRKHKEGGRYGDGTSQATASYGDKCSDHQIIRRYLAPNPAGTDLHRSRTRDRGAEIAGTGERGGSGDKVGGGDDQSGVLFFQLGIEPNERACEIWTGPYDGQPRNNKGGSGQGECSAHGACATL